VESGFIAEVKREEVSGRRKGSNLEFAGRVALITGGNSGIGAAAARRLAEQTLDGGLTAQRPSVVQPESDQNAGDETLRVGLADRSISSSHIRL
jgi:NADP-dependent 3-hydroxy acid dehydrogenase YdfG